MKKAAVQLQNVLHLCDVNSEFNALPSFFTKDWKEIKCSERAEQNPDILCSLLDLNLLGDANFDAIWMPSGLNTIHPMKLQAFLKSLFKLLKKNGFLCLITPNIKELARLIYQTAWNEPIQNLKQKLSPKNLLFSPNILHEQAYVKNGFTAKDLIDSLTQAGFGKLEMIDQGLTLTTRAFKVPLAKNETCLVNFQEFDLNQKIHQRDSIHREPTLAVVYPPKS